MWNGSSQLDDLSRTKDVTIESNFRIDWDTLNITKKEIHVRLGINVGTKREPIYDTNNVWVETQPKDVLDFAWQDLTILKLELDSLKEQLATKDKEYNSMEWKYASLEEYAKCWHRHYLLFLPNLAHTLH